MVDMLQKLRGVFALPMKIEVLSARKAQLMLFIQCRLWNLTLKAGLLFDRPAFNRQFIFHNRNRRILN